MRPGGSHQHVVRVRVPAETQPAQDLGEQHPCPAGKRGSPAASAAKVVVVSRSTKGSRLPRFQRACVGGPLDPHVAVLAVDIGNHVGGSGQVGHADLLVSVVIGACPFRLAAGRVRRRHPILVIRDRGAAKAARSGRRGGHASSAALRFGLTC
jgi:hypothetical protein